jgi:carbamoyl-phosphate synthase large subunit
MVKIATQIMTSELTGIPSPLADMKEVHPAYYGVKEAVFPFNMFQEVDPVLGPDMRSTGEVLGLSTNVGEAFYKAQEATQTKLPTKGTVLFSVSRKDKPEVVEIAKIFEKCGFHILGTGTTYELLVANGIKADRINKMQEGRPNIVDEVMNGNIQLIINTPAVDEEKIFDDSYVRKTAIKARIPYMTTMAAAKATAEGIETVIEQGEIGVMSLQDIHKQIH